VSRLAGRGDFRFITGEAERSFTRRARSVIVVNESGLIVGYGRARRGVRDLLPFDDSVSPWNAFVPTSQSRASQLTIYLAHGRDLVCRAGVRGRRAA
jgi:hypothetical protein